MSAMNRTQIPVLTFFLVALAALGVVLTLSPEIYSQTLRFAGHPRILGAMH